MPPPDYSSTISGQYSYFLDRAPTAAESAYWNRALQLKTATVGSLDAALVNTSAGQALLPEAVGSLYQLDAGRAATSAEVTYWSGQLQSGAIDLAGMQATFAALPGAQVHVERTFIQLFAAEYGINLSPAQADGELSNVLQVTLYQAERDAQPGTNEFIGSYHRYITNAYETYVARGPSSQELDYWTNAFSKGQALPSDITSALAGSSFGQAHIGTTVSLLYETDFGRDPSSDELTYWKGQVQGGETLDQINDLLQSISTAANVVHRTSDTTAATTFTYGADHLIIDGFKSADVINFSAGGHPLFNALTHAVQTIGTDNMADVLITLNPYETVLLHHVQLSSLSASNFL